MGKITVRNFTTLTDYAALLRAGQYLAGYCREAQEGGFRFRITAGGRNGTIIKITETEE